MATLVEDRTALRTDEMREACDLSALLGVGRNGVTSREAHPLRKDRTITKRTLASGAQTRRSPGSRENPGAQLERRSVTDVLVMTAVELGDPPTVRVLPKTTDPSLHTRRSPD
jgi:hypothetical protein